MNQLDKSIWIVRIWIVRIVAKMTRVLLILCVASYFTSYFVSYVSGTVITVRETTDMTRFPAMHRIFGKIEHYTSGGGTNGNSASTSASTINITEYIQSIKPIHPSIRAELTRALVYCQHNERMHLELFDNLQFNLNGVVILRITDVDNNVGYSVDVDIVSDQRNFWTTLLQLIVLILCGFFLGRVI